MGYIIPFVLVLFVGFIALLAYTEIPHYKEIEDATTPQEIKAACAFFSTYSIQHIPAKCLGHF